MKVLQMSRWADPQILTSWSSLNLPQVHLIGAAISWLPGFSACLINRHANTSSLLGRECTYVAVSKNAHCPFFPGVLATTDLEAAVKGVDVAVMVGGFPRKAGMERKDVMSKNVSIYQSQAAALEKGASKDVKVHSTWQMP